MKKFDVIVIGSGPAGTNTAQTCAEAGKKVAVIDHEFGGTCALKGCTPKKVMAVTSEILRYACHLNGFGINQVDVELNWSALLDFKRSFTEMTPMHSKEGFKKRGITVIEGTAKFIDKNVLSVDGEKYSAENIVVATGAKPTDLPIKGSEHMVKSEQVLELDAIPDNVIFVGGGYVAFEFAQIMKKAGCQVALLEATDQPIRGFDPFLVSRLVESFQQEKIDVRTGFEVKEIKKIKDKFEIYGQYANESTILTCDMVVHGVGRSPNIDQLDLKKGGVKFTKAGINVNANLQSVSNEYVYCAGDVADTGWPFTLVADYEGHVVASNILKDRNKRVSLAGVPVVLFTSPKMASVGQSEQELIENKIEFEKKQGDISHHLMSRSLQEKYSGYKVFIDKKGKILGAHLIGPKADEVINGFAMAMQHNLTVTDLKRTFMSYPTAFAEIRKMI